MEKLVLDRDKVTKLLCILERSLIHTEDDENRIKLIDLQFDLMDELAEFLDVNLDEGTIDPSSFEYVKFRDLKKNI